MTVPDDLSLDIRPDASDLGIKREQLMFDEQLLDDAGYAIYGLLHAQKAGNPRMSLQDLYKQLWTWRCWRECKGNCREVALRMREKGWGDATEEQVIYRIRRMAKLGFFSHTSGNPRLP